MPHTHDARIETVGHALGHGLGRRGFLRAAGAATAAGGLGAAAAGTAQGAAGAPATGPGSPVLQPGRGRIRGTYVRARPDEVAWGYLPNRDSAPVATVARGTSSPSTPSRTRA